KIGLPFFCYTYPTTHTPEVLAMLEDSGCHAITMGVQSGSQRILTEIYDRPTRVGRVIEAAQEIANSGIPAATFDIIPQTEFDTEEDLKETFEIMLQLPKQLDSTFYNKMAYFPNYPIQDKFKDDSLMARSGSLSEEDYLYYFKLYDLTRSAMPVEKIRSIAEDYRYRNNHNLLNEFLSDGKALKENYGNLIDMGIERRKNSLFKKSMDS